MRHPRSPGLRLWRLLCLAAAACGLAACGNLNSIHRTLDTAGGTGALIDAKQRAIIVGERVEVVEVTRMQEQGKDQSKEPVVMKEPSRRYVVCAEPSPDAMSAYAAEFAAEISKTSADGAALAAGVKSALQEAAAFIGMRTPSIQLLRDAMYRVCEAYSNGAINPGQYELLMRRYQRHMVVLMAIEQLTQAGRVPVVTITTQGSVGGDRPLSEWTDEIKRQQIQLDKPKAALAKAQSEGEAAQVAVKKADEALKTNANDTAAQKDKTTAEEAQKKAESDGKAAQQEIKQIEQRISDLKERMPGATALAGRSAAEVAAGSAADSARNVAKVAPVVERIVNKVLDTDDTGALCFEHAKSGVPQATLDKLCTAYLGASAAAHSARAAYVSACTRQHSGDANRLAACLAKTPTPPPSGAEIHMIPGQ